jgi:hypothetical protein
VLSSATDEIQLIFSRASSLKRYERLGMINILRKKEENGIVTRILIGTDNPINKKEVEWLSEYPRIELRYLIVVRANIGDNLAYPDGLHFCCQEVYPYRNQNKV